MGFFEKMKAGLSRTRDGVMRQMDGVLHAFTKINEELFEELTDLLVLADVGVDTTDFIIGELRRRVKAAGITDPARVKDELRAVMVGVLGEEEGLDLSTTPSVVLVIGVNGVGKTTTIGKLAARMTAEGKKVVLAAADTFRAAAIDQLAIWAQRSGAQLVRQDEGSDPAAVVFDALSAAKARGADVVLCDTAGRLHNKKNLMDELAKISRVIDREAPEAARENLLVLDATTGQNAVNQARQFGEAAGLTGIILTKLDGTARGGVVLAIRHELGIPVKYVGVGEHLDDLQPFSPKDFVGALFGDETAQ